jgi:transposase
VRRGFYDLAKTKAPIAIEASRRIAALYAIEERVRGENAEERLAVRRAESRPRVGDLRGWFEEQIARLPARGPTAQAIRYALNQWDGLVRFLEDGRIDLEPTRCAIEKKQLFAGSDEGGENLASLASLIETCKPNGVNPQTYFTELLTRLVHG